ncbi:MAG: glycerophosphodiester phosphodiesterase family protein [Bacteroidales bacterium]|nr:glycerophosphodiester phosphodiesterase family protein [Bacteroidales bacterium]
MIFLSINLSIDAQYSLSKFPNNKVMIVSHRGNWREAPENSIWSVKKAIEKGANMVEIDLAMTKDSILVLMHDNTIDRTTSGKGKVIDYTYDEISKLVLRDGLGVKTAMKIPTIDQILDICKDKVLINLDKSFNYFDIVYPKLVERNMLDQVLLKGNMSFKVFNEKYGDIKDKIHYMPIISLEKDNAQAIIDDFTKTYKPYGFEFVVGNDEKNLIDFKSLREKGYHVWINALWPQHNAGHSDDMALENPDIYQWFIDNNVNIIQTDRIVELKSFLKRKKLYKSNN